MVEEATEIGNGWVRDAEGQIRRADRPDGAGQCKTPTDGGAGTAGWRGAAKNVCRRAELPLQHSYGRAPLREGWAKRAGARLLLRQGEKR